MIRIDAKKMHFKELNDIIREASEEVVIDNCVGQRFIAAGASDLSLTINGTPGNALGAYLDGGNIVVNGNGEDAVGDTMNKGSIIIHGSVGDAPGYAMRGGKIYALGNSGYRTGIHMKQYKDKCPLMIIGGATGSFLGEYLAGGNIIVLNLNNEKNIVGNFTGTGMHGGRIFLRTDSVPTNIAPQVAGEFATEEDMASIADYLKDYAEVYKLDYDSIIAHKFVVLTPNAKNQYKRLYTVN